MAATCVGIEIGGTKLQIVTGDARGSVGGRFHFSVDRAAGATGIRRQIEGTLRRLVAAEDILALGVGYGGPVDWRTGHIRCSHHVAGWSDFPLGAWLHEIAGCPVAVDNDANVAALGEARLGAGSGRNPVFYVTLGSGVGGGLVAEGRVFHGASPGEAEIGHVRLDRAGTTVESRCSGWAVDRRIREQVQREPSGVLARLVGESSGAEARHLAAALHGSDPAARDILREAAADLAFGLSHVVHLFHPEVIVLGGGLSLLGEPLRAAATEALPPFVMDAFQPPPAIALATLREDAVPVGALLLAGALG